MNWYNIIGCGDKLDKFDYSKYNFEPTYADQIDEEIIINFEDEVEYYIYKYLEVLNLDLTNFEKIKTKTYLQLSGIALKENIKIGHIIEYLIYFFLTYEFNNICLKNKKLLYGHVKYYANRYKNNFFARYSDDLIQISYIYLFEVIKIWDPINNDLFMPLLMDFIKKAVFNFYKKSCKTDKDISSVEEYLAYNIGELSLADVVLSDNLTYIEFIKSCLKEMSDEEKSILKPYLFSKQKTKEFLLETNMNERTFYRKFNNALFKFRNIVARRIEK